MKKTSIALAIAVSFGVTGVAQAQFSVTLGDGPGAVAGQAIESSVVAMAMSSVNQMFVENPEFSVGGEIGATFGAITGGILQSDIAGGGPGGLSSLDTGESAYFNMGGQTQVVTNGAAEFQGTAGSTNGMSGAMFSADGVSLFDVTAIEMVAQTTGDTYSSLDGASSGDAGGGGFADVDLLQTGISHIDIEGFTLETTLVGDMFDPM